MKKILFIIFNTSLLLNVFAQNSNLTIFSEDGNPFYIILNGIRQNENPETNVRVDNLSNTYYSAKIIFADESISSIEKKMLMVIDPDGKKGAVTYKIKKTKKGALVLRFFSFTPASVKSSAPSNVSVVQFNTKPMPIIVFETTTVVTNSPASNVNTEINMGGVNIGIQVNDNFNTQTTTTTTSSTTYYNDNVVVEDEVECSINNSMFESAKQSIKKQTFSDTKLSQAKQITKINCLTAEQTKEICALFDYEDDKLEYAKFAYGYCLDSKNYWLINDVFNFESSVEELNEYINLKKEY